MKFYHGLQFTQLVWLWRRSRSFRKQSIVNIVLGLLLVGVDFTFIFSSKEIVDVATGVSHCTSVVALGILLVILIFIQLALRLLHRWFSVVLGVKGKIDMQREMFASVLGNVWLGREKRHSGDVINRILGDVGTIVNLITETAPKAIVVVVRLLGAFYLLCLLEYRLAFVVIVLLPVFIVLSKAYVRKMRSLTHEIREIESKQQSLIQEYLQHILVIKTLQQKSQSIKRLQSVQDNLYERSRYRARFSLFSVGTVSLGFSMIYLLSFLWGIYNLHHEIITYGTMMAFVQLVAQIQLPFREMTRFIPEVVGTLTAVDRIMTIEATEHEEESEVRYTVCDNHRDRQLGVRFVYVTSRYSANQRIVLNDFSFDFSPGSSTIIMGATGRGKTTIVRLILSLIKPNSGSVEFYDAKSCWLASESTRSDIVYVPQGNTLLGGTIRENLLLGSPNATEDDIHYVLDLACADFVYDLKDGLNTQCGELGTGLSEGQAQRIVIARSLLHGGRILLLDEATSALDVRTEQQVLIGVLEHARKYGQTVICVSHHRDNKECFDNLLEL